MLVKLAVFQAQLVMATMSKLMSQCQNIILLAHKIQHQIRMLVANRTAAKRTAALAVARRNIYPVVVKKIFSDVIQLRRKFFIGVQHNLHRLIPAICSVGSKRQRRVSIPISNFFNSQPLCFQFIKAFWNVFIMFFHSLRQNFNRFIADIFTQIARRNRSFKTAFFIFNSLIFHHHIIDKGH